ncbi:hypothetical protein BASA81_003589 [Batrachochytrium salamandrivorans]|nr:hypothetical protein BASA81_003589 [Batrachochytrium salamandrivorans]
MTDRSPSSSPPPTAKASFKRLAFISVALLLGLVFFLRDERLLFPSGIQHPPTISMTTTAVAPTISKWDEEAGKGDSIFTMKPLVSMFDKPRLLCKDTDSKVRLYFPHVNKAGGRTIEGTFDLLSTNPQFRFLSKQPRSHRFKFELVNGHHDHIQLVKIKKANDLLLETGVCSRWIYMMREPLARTLSAFYTSVGRAPVPNDEPTTPLTDHFYCDSPKVQQLMQREDFDFEAFARLPKTDRDTCQDKTGDVQVKYLSRRRDWRVVRRRTQDMAFVGLAEEFDLSMQLLDWELELGLNLYTPIFNRNEYPRNLSDLAIAALKELNSMDLPFYDYVKTQVFPERVRAMRYAKSLQQQHQNRQFVCDREVICWDKRKPLTNSQSKEDVFWNVSLPPPAGVFKTSGEEKSNSLCGMRRGCLMAPEYPPPRLCTASFFILGARKGGTTSMYLYLAQHPKVKGVFMDNEAKSGETFFFERVKSSLGTGVVRNRYNKLFERQLKGTGFDPLQHLTGESSVGTGASCQTPLLLRQTCGLEGNKLIYLLRHPVERMVSQHQMRVRLDTLGYGQSSDFAVDATNALRAFKAMPEYTQLLQWLATDNLTSASPPPCLFPDDHANPNPIWGSLYVVHLARWLRHFPPSHLLVLQSEKFFHSPETEFVTAMRFLDLDPSLVNTTAITAQVFNKDTSQPHINDVNDKKTIPLAPILRELDEFFRPFNDKLMVLLASLSSNFSPDFTKWNEYV